ncbi:4Fe-4S dicluster domain-containing protein [Metabacillus fastidiosus]|uniref:4Fe-4S dicluster domain-containing protein n=1 Tax=Metabacillus fastidiosus TaxID=1458 RepID=UPI0008265A74|nr:ferredoxin family protein [Metabacillus fastidiosus]MED4464589.1 ferredoxin family protein [Metabacillus fastidiosus]
MIELISTTKCVNCNLCVKVCPTNVFDKADGGIPVIARQQDCQTCFMCEVYCPADALYVAPEAEESVFIVEKEVEEAGLLGNYRKAVGWGKGRKPAAVTDTTYFMLKALRG